MFDCKNRQEPSAPETDDAAQQDRVPEDPRVAQIRDALLHDNSFDAEAAFQIAVNTHLESQQGHALLPSEVVLRTIAEVRALQFARQDYEPQPNGVRVGVPLPSGGWASRDARANSASADATERGPERTDHVPDTNAVASAPTNEGQPFNQQKHQQTERAKADAARRTATLNELESPQSRLTVLLQTVLAHRDAWSEYERLVLEIQECGVRISDERSDNQDKDQFERLAGQISKLADKAGERFPASATEAWAHGRALQPLRRLFHWKRQGAAFKDFLRHLEQALAARYGVASVRGLLFTLAGQTLRMHQAPMDPSQSQALHECLARHEDVLLDAYLLLDETQLLDRIALCTLLALVRKNRKEEIHQAFSWEAIQLTIRYLGEFYQDRDLDWFCLTLQEERPFLDRQLKPVMDCARWLRGQMRANADSAATEPMQPLSSSPHSMGLAQLLKWHAHQVPNMQSQRLRGLLNRCLVDDEQLLKLPEELLPHARDGAIDALMERVGKLSTDASVEQRIAVCLVKAIAYGNNCRVAELRRALDEAVALLPPGECRRTDLLRWSVYYQRARARRQQQDQLGAQADFREAGRCAARAFAIHRVAQTVLAQQLLHESAVADIQARQSASVLRLLCGLGFLADHTEAVRHCAVGHFPPWAHGNKAQVPLLRKVDQANERLFEQRLDQKTIDKRVGQHYAASLPTLYWASAWAGALGGSPGTPAATIAKSLDDLRQRVGKRHQLAAWSAASWEIAGRLGFATMGRPGRSPTVGDWSLRSGDIEEWTKAAQELTGSLHAKAQVFLGLIDVTLLQLEKVDDAMRTSLLKLLRQQLNSFQALAEKPLERDWWQGSQLQTRALELVARATRVLGSSEQQHYRRVQFEQRMEPVRVLHNTELAQGQHLRWQRDVASLLQDRQTPPQQVYALLDSVKSTNLAAELDAPPAADALSTCEDDDLTALESPKVLLPEAVRTDAVNVTSGTVSWEVTTSERDETTTPGCTIALEYMMAPSAQYGPTWDAICLASEVLRTSSGFRVRALRTFYLGASNTPRQRALERQCKDARASMNAAVRAFFVHPDASNLPTDRRPNPRKQVDKLVMGKIGRTLFPTELMDWLETQKPTHVYLCPHQWLFHLPLHALPTVRGLAFINAPFTVSYLPTVRALKESGFASALVSRTTQLPIFADSTAPTVVEQLRSADGEEYKWKQAQYNSCSDLLSQLRRHRGAAFICHGLHDGRAGMSWRSRLLLEHGVRLTAQVVSQSIDSFAGAEVLMLACQAGAARVEWGNNVGLLDAILAGGRAARNVVAPLYPIHTRYVGEFLRSYLTARADNKSPQRAYQAAVLAVRTAAIKEQGQASDVETSDEFRVWMEYCPYVLYGPA